jgi:hypothetical protein
MQLRQAQGTDQNQSQGNQTAKILVIPGTMSLVAHIDDRTS